MNYLKKYYALVFLLIFCYVGISDNKTLHFYFFIFILLSTIYNGFIEISKIKKGQILDAEIMGFDPDVTDEGFNFLLYVKVYLHNQEVRNITIKALYFRPPKKGDKIKILLNEADIQQSTLFKGNEITYLYVQMASICLFLFFIYYWIFVLSK